MTTGSTRSLKAATYSASPEPAASGTLRVELVTRPRAAAAGVERPLVERDDEHRVVAAEDGVGAVPVMDVPVDDRHSLDAERILRVTGRDRNVVEDAEPHRVAAQRVVAGRPDQRKASGLDRRDRASCGQPRRFPGGRPGERVAVQPGLFVDRGDRLDVCSVVGALDLLAARPHAFAPAAERLEEDREPLGPLGMVMAPRRMEVCHRGMRDQLDAASSSRPASRPRPSSSAAAPPARQSGSRSGSAGTGAEGSSVAMCR